MAKSDKKVTNATAQQTGKVVDAVKVVREMGGKRARFVLTALLVNDSLALADFWRACKMADQPHPIEEAAAPAARA